MTRRGPETRTMGGAQRSPSSGPSLMGCAPLHPSYGSGCRQEPPSTRTPSVLRGFTLIEVMIAGMILALMGTLVFGSFEQAYRQKQATEKEDNRYQQIRAAMDRMALEISEAFVSEHFDRSRYQQRPTRFKGEDDGDNDQLTFTALANERFRPDEKTSDEVVLKYFLRQDPDHDYQDLYRRTNPIIDEDAMRKGRRQVLCENVRGLDFKYWDQKQDDWVDEWDTNKPEHDGVLPDRVKITLKYKDENGDDRKISTQTQIMLTKSLDF